MISSLWRLIGAFSCEDKFAGPERVTVGQLGECYEPGLWRLEVDTL